VPITVFRRGRWVSRGKDTRRQNDPRGLGEGGGEAQFYAEVFRDAKDIERLKQSGELIFAYQYAIQAQQTKLVAQYDPDEPAFGDSP
jgi:hypothetical protein